MQNFSKKILIVIGLIIFVFFFKPLGTFAQSDSAQTNVSLNVVTEVSCNDNGICEPALGENELNCFNDCGCNNNGACEAQRGETAVNCPNDCANPPVIPPTGGGGGGQLLELYIENLKISKITFDSAEISWQTSKSAQCATYFGTTSEYEKETISETQASQNHLSDLTDLSPTAEYHFNIICKSADNFSAQTKDKYFTTLYVISNVNNFTAKAGQQEIFLNWENPVDQNFQSVSLVKNQNFYPKNINDGTLLYEGNAQSFDDKNVAINQGYYYAIFAEGKNGSWSSGALAFAKIQPETPTTPVTPLTPIAPVAPVNAQLKLSDFDFYSGAEKIPVINEKTVNPKANNSLIVSIDYKKVPVEYKEMFFQLNAGDNKFYYIFQLNKEKTVYSLRLVSPLKQGTYPLAITFFDQNNKLISELNGEMLIPKTQSSGTPINILLILIIILILLILVLFLLFKSRRKQWKTC